MTKRICSADGCERVHQSRGWCDLHYRRMLKHGELDPFKPERLPAEDGGFKQQLPCGNWFYFDEQDAELVGSCRWYIVTGYVQTESGCRKNGDRKTHRLHRLIMDPGSDQLVDHHNRNRLDNRRCNLRIANKSQNGMNRGMQANNTTGFKGAYKHIEKSGLWEGRWKAQICVNKRQKYLGLFPTAEAAHAAYVKAANELHGEFACSA